MSKRKYLNVAHQNRLGRVGARLLLSLMVAFAAVLFKSSLVHAESAAPSADLIGTWVMADVPGANDVFTVNIGSRQDHLVLSLPEQQMRLPSGQDVVLTPCEARVYCSAKDFSPTVRLEMLGKDKLDLTVKGSYPNGFAYFDLPLRRAAAD